MRKLICVVMALAISMAIIGCKKEEKPEEKAAGAISKALDNAGKAVSDAGKSVSDAANK